MSNIVRFPQNMRTAPAQAKNVPPGEYGVRVKKMSFQPPSRITALYEVIDAGEFRGAMLWDSFNLEYERGQEMMSEFLAAIEVVSEGGELDLDMCEGKTLCVSVKEKGQWLNVISHRPDF